MGRINSWYIFPVTSELRDLAEAFDQGNITLGEFDRGLARYVQKYAKPLLKDYSIEEVKAAVRSQLRSQLRVRV